MRGKLYSSSILPALLVTTLDTSPILLLFDHNSQKVRYEAANSR